MKRILTNPKIILIVWLLAAVACSLDPIFNNFRIFRGVFWHTVSQTSLFAEYPEEYFDVNYYGPFFSLIIAPFAVLPLWPAKILWNVCMTFLLCKVIYKLPFGQQKLAILCWFCLQVLTTALQMYQFNIVITALIILSFLFIEKEKDIWATLMIAVGTFVKLYGIVGLAFFFFSKHKGKFILSLIGWSLVCYLLPMLISSPEYVNGQYVEWFHSLVGKNGENQDSLYQNISLLGMVHRISGCWFSDLFLIIPGLVLFALPYLRLRQYVNPGFRFALLASVLLFTVLFSTGSETSTYIIAFTGVGIWYWSAPWKRDRLDLGLMILAFILTSLSPSDLFPAYVRVHLVRPYSLVALPCVLIWFKLIYEMLFCDYRQQ